MKKIAIILILALFVVGCVNENQTSDTQLEEQKILPPNIVVNDEVLNAISNAIDNNAFAGERISNVTHNVTQHNTTIIQVEVLYEYEFRKQLVDIFMIMYTHAYADQYNVRVRQVEFRDYVYECSCPPEWVGNLIDKNLSEDEFYRGLTVIRWGGEDSPKIM